MRIAVELPVSYSDEIRVEWNINGHTGHSEWFHHTDIHVHECVKAANLAYGEGTHWIRYERTVKTIEYAI